MSQGTHEIDPLTLVMFGEPYRNLFGESEGKGAEAGDVVGGRLGRVGRVLGACVAAATLAAGFGVNSEARNEARNAGDPATELQGSSDAPAQEYAFDGTLISRASDIYETRPGTGSCSPWTRADVEAIEAGTKQKPTTDLLGQHGSQLAMFKQNPEFARNFANSIPGYVFDLAGVDRQSATADKAITSIIENPYFVAAQLAGDEKSLNHYCDDKGNVLPTSEGVVTLPKDTYVAGFIVDKQTQRADGQIVTKFKNGKEVVLPSDVQLVEVKDAAGKKVLMLVTNKAGINTDKDWDPEVGCFNPQRILRKTIALPPTTTTLPPATTTTLPPATTTTVPPPATTTTVPPPATTTTVPPPATTTTLPVHPPASGQPPGATIPPVSQPNTAGYQPGNAENVVGQQDRETPGGVNPTEFGTPAPNGSPSNDDQIVSQPGNTARNNPDYTPGTESPGTDEGVNDSGTPASDTEVKDETAEPGTLPLDPLGGLVFPGVMLATSYRRHQQDLLRLLSDTTVLGDDLTKSRK